MNRRNFLGALVAAPAVAPEIAKQAVERSSDIASLSLSTADIDFGTFGHAIGDDGPNVGLSELMQTPSVFEQYVHRPIQPPAFRHPSGRPIRYRYAVVRA